MNKIALLCLFTAIFLCAASAALECDSSEAVRKCEEEYENCIKTEDSCSCLVEREYCVISTFCFGSSLDTVEEMCRSESCECVFMNITSSSSSSSSSGPVPANPPPMLACDMTQQVVTCDRAYNDALGNLEYDTPEQEIEAKCGVIVKFGECLKYVKCGRGEVMWTAMKLCTTANCAGCPFYVPDGSGSGSGARSSAGASSTTSTSTSTSISSTTSVSLLVAIVAFVATELLL